jgi:hypothetical protein
MSNNENINNNKNNNSVGSNSKTEVIDERVEMGKLLYDIQSFNIECRTAILMNNRINYYRGKN